MIRLTLLEIMNTLNDADSVYVGDHRLVPISEDLLCQIAFSLGCASAELEEYRAKDVPFDEVPTLGEVDRNFRH